MTMNNIKSPPNPIRSPLGRKPAGALDFDGRRYAVASKHQKEWGTGLIGELRLRGNERILDLGCGDGALTARMADLTPRGHVVGIDASPGMLREARKNSRPNLEFLLLDIRRMAFHRAFDVVYSNAALHWIKDHDDLLSRIARSLRPGGVARLSFGGDGNCPTFNRVVQAVMALPKYAVAFKGFEWPWYFPGVKDYEALARSKNFGEVRVWLENADRLFPDARTMTHWVDQPCLVPFVAQLNASKAREFRSEVIRGMIDATLQPDGRCLEQFRRLNLHARL
jgi:trans-aconitate 2-methyltransferase